MRYLKVILFFMIFVFLYGQTYAAKVVYPIQKMSKPECRFQDYSTLGEDCKQDLPILKTKDYSKFKNDYSTYRRVYTVLWGGSYTYGWDVGNGGHQGVDIATAKGTPVVSMSDGKVLRAGEIAGGRGLTVKIEHNINGKKIYTNYSHLSKIDVKVGQTVTAGQKIAEVGSTGNSTGNHLHFQIDLTKAGGPRYRTKCKVKNYDSIVNGGACFEELSQNTIDPLYFLENNGSVIKSETVVEKPKTEVISTVGLISNEEILRREIDEFLKRYEIKAEIQSLAGNLELGKTGILKITAQNKFTKVPFNGNFPGNMSFKFDNKKFYLFPTSIFAIDKGTRDIQITAKATGYQYIEIFIGESFITKVKIGILNPDNGIMPYHTEFDVPDKNIISDINAGSLYFKTKEGISLLGSKYVGTYYLTSPDKSLKFCIKRAKNVEDIEKIKNQECSEFSFVHDAYFAYKDTTEGILVFDYKITGNQKTQIQVKKASNHTTIAYYSIIPENPSTLRREYQYYNEMLEIGKVGIIAGVSDGYFMEDRVLTLKDGIAYVRNTLAFLKTNCKTDACKQTINSRIGQLRKYDLPKYSNVKLTRIQFSALVAVFIPSSNTNFDKIAYRDLSSKEQRIVNIAMKNFLWKDVYGQSRYFQPKNKITRGEAAYLIYNYIK